MNVTALIAARMDSRRLPGKVLAPLGAMPLVEVAWRRARRARRVAHVVLATSDRPTDDPLADWGAGVGADVYRGPADDVAARLLEAARAHGADAFLRLNGDSPFVDPGLLDEAVAHWERRPVDLVSNLGTRRFPYGIAVELVRVEAFERARAWMTTPELREHVTQALYRNAERLEIDWIEIPDEALETVRLVVDTEADYRVLTAVAAALGGELLTADWRRVAQVWQENATRTRDLGAS